MEGVCVEEGVCMEEQLMQKVEDGDTSNRGHFWEEKEGGRMDFLVGFEVVVVGLVIGLEVGVAVAMAED